MAAQPPFFLQIADTQGAVVHTRAGGRHEINLVESLVKAILAKGVGFFRTSSHVEADIRVAIAEVIYDLKVKDPSDTID